MRFHAELLRCALGIYVPRYRHLAHPAYDVQTWIKQGSDYADGAFQMCKAIEFFVAADYKDERYKIAYENIKKAIQIFNDVGAKSPEEVVARGIGALCLLKTDYSLATKHYHLFSTAPEELDLPQLLVMFEDYVTGRMTLDDERHVCKKLLLNMLMGGVVTLRGTQPMWKELGVK